MANATIPALPRAARTYIAEYHLVAIVNSPDGRVAVKRNPAGAAAAWWCSEAEARRVARHARADSHDIPAAAAALAVPLTEHGVVMERVGASVARIDAALAEAQRCGLLAAFNDEYQRRREAAKTSGKTFMPYGRARARLHRAIAGIIAKGGGRDLDIAAIRRVFE